MKPYFSLSTHNNHTISQDSQKSALLSDLEQTKKALEIAYAGFDNVTEPDLIDCYIYEVNSVYKRYKFLLNQAMQLGMISQEDQIIPNTDENLCSKSPVASLVS